MCYGLCYNLTLIVAFYWIQCLISIFFQSHKTVCVVITRLNFNVNEFKISITLWVNTDQIFHELRIKLLAV